eukprot:436736-Karenia_brevis.AAC.1
MPQTSQSAEHSGRAAAVQMLRGQAVLHGDCKPVVQLAQAPAHTAAGRKQFHAGSRRAAENSLHAHLVTADVKVKAHRDLVEAVDDTDRRHVLGNQHADSGAVAAKLYHDQLSPAQRSDLDRYRVQYKKICEVIGSVLQLWPAAEKTVQPQRAAPKRQRKRMRAKAELQHSWIWRNEHWVCRCCLTTARTEAGRHRKDMKNCEQANPRLLAIVSQPQGHNLVAMDSSSSEGVLLCTTCGAWATNQPIKLLQPCQGVPKTGSAGAQALARVSNQRHPRAGSKETVGGMFSLRGHASDVDKTINRLLDAGECRVDSSAAVTLGQGSSTISGVVETVATCSAAQERLARLRARVVAKAKEQCD